MLQGVLLRLHLIMNDKANSYEKRNPSAVKRRISTGSIAIPFLITILISMVILGGFGYYIYHRLTDDNHEIADMPGAVTSISENDIFQIFMVLQPDHPDRKPAAMLFRFDPLRKEEYCIGIPMTLQVEHNDQKMTLQQCIENYGVSFARDAVEIALDQEIDRYIAMDSAGFQRVVTIFGNVSCVVTIHDDGLDPSDVSQMLDHSQLEVLLTSNQYYSETERCTVIGQAISQLINQANAKRILLSLDGSFSAVVNATSNDLTALDFTSHRHALAYVLEHVTAPAKTTSLYGTEQDGVLILNDSDLETLKLLFSQIS